MGDPDGADRRTRRLFFALWPDDALRVRLVRETRKAVRRSGGRPVPPRNLHATLAFLGNQPAQLFDGIVAAAARVRATGAELVLDRYGYWPKPRVFWIGPAECPPALARLSRDLWSRLTELGIEPDVRQFRPHVTLARKVAAVPEVPEPEPLGWQVSEFALVESVTDRRGARYRVVHRFGL